MAKEPKKSKELIIMNGGMFGKNEHVYICAKNKTDAARMLLQAEIKLEDLEGVDPDDKFLVSRWLREINGYFSIGCWGNPMEGIPQERGLWYHEKWNEPVKRLI